MAAIQGDLPLRFLSNNAAAINADPATVGVGYQNAYNSALAVNEANYQNILRGYNQAIAETTTANDATAAGYVNLGADVQQQLKGADQARRQEIGDQYTQEEAKADQSLISRGLGNTTVRDAVKRGYELDKAKAITDTANKFAMTLAQYAAQIGLSRLQFEAMSKQQKAAMMQNMLQWMNSINAPYPNAQHWQDLARNAGQHWQQLMNRPQFRGPQMPPQGPQGQRPPMQQRPPIGGGFGGQGGNNRIAPPPAGGAGRRGVFDQVRGGNLKGGGGPGGDPGVEKDGPYDPWYDNWYNSLGNNPTMGPNDGPQQPDYAGESKDYGLGETPSGSKRLVVNPAAMRGPGLSYGWRFGLPSYPDGGSGVGPGGVGDLSLKGGGAPPSSEPYDPWYDNWYNSLGGSPSGPYSETKSPPGSDGPGYIPAKPLDGGEPYSGELKGPGSVPSYLDPMKGSGSYLGSGGDSRGNPYNNMYLPGWENPGGVYPPIGSPPPEEQSSAWPSFNEGWLGGSNDYGSQAYGPASSAESDPWYSNWMSGSSAMGAGDTEFDCPGC